MAETYQLKLVVSTLFADKEKGADNCTENARDFVAILLCLWCAHVTQKRDTFFYY